MSPDLSIMTPADASSITQGTFDSLSGVLPFASILPNTVNDEGLTRSWAANTHRDEDEAKYRAYDAQTVKGKTTGKGGSFSLNLQPLSHAQSITEYSIILNSGMSDDWVRAKLSEYFDKLGRDLAWRVERSKIDTFVNAVFDFDDDEQGGNAYDFRRDAKLNVTVKTKWNDAASDPIKDIQAWQKLIKTAEGDAPTTLVTTRNVVDTLMVNPSVIKYAAASAANEAALQLPQVGLNVVTNVLTQYTGIRKVLIVDDAFQTVVDNIFANTQVKMRIPSSVLNAFPANTVMLSADYVGVEALGPTAEQYLSGYGLSDSQIAAGVFPSQSFAPGFDAYATMTALPVLDMANSTLKATVL